jgi:phosphatidylinositol alpha-mannosyltransferase
MRIALVCPYSVTIPGGVQHQVLGLADELRKTHDVRVIAPSDGPPPLGTVAVGPSRAVDTNGSLAPVAVDPLAQIRTINALLDGAFDVVHLHEPLCPGPTLTGLLLRSAPLVGTFYAADASAGYRLAVRPILRSLAHRLDRRCAVSDDAATLARQWLGGRYEAAFVACTAERSTAPPGPRPGPPGVFFCARHEPRKGLGVLLEASDHVQAEAQFWIASNGPETAALAARWPGSERIRWLGRVSEQDKRSRIAAAGLVCVPSLRGESFGVVLLEAMAMGKALVTTDVPGHARVARHGREALLTQPGDPHSLATAIDKVLGDTALAHELGENGRRRAAEFAMSDLATFYEGVYQEACAR